MPDESVLVYPAAAAAAPMVQGASSPIPKVSALSDDHTQNVSGQDREHYPPVVPNKTFESP
jgi:hypothetical protein